MTVTRLAGTRYKSDSKPLASGGTGSIYRILSGTSNKVAKIYHADRFTLDLPDSTVFTQVAWALDALYDQNRMFYGFVEQNIYLNKTCSFLTEW